MSTHLPIAERVAQPFGVAEDWLSFIFTNLLTLGLGGFIEYCFEQAWHRRVGMNVSLVGFTALAWLYFDLPFLFRLWSTILRKVRHPSLAIAQSQKLLPTFLRPLPGLWWLAHFLGGVAAVIGISLMRPPSGHDDAFMRFTFATCSGFAANGYLIMAVAAMTRSDQIRRRVWKCRVLLDLSLALVAWHAFR